MQSIRFSSRVTLTGQPLRVGSGVVTVDREVMATAETDLVVPHGLIKRGEGTLVVSSVDAVADSTIEAGVLGVRQLTDEGIMYLEDAPQLREIWASQNLHVSAAASQELRNRMQCGAID
ncbi:MAG: hypothetical protein ACC645_19865 [Pirellulales bacterium]